PPSAGHDFDLKNNFAEDRLATTDAELAAAVAGAACFSGTLRISDAVTSLTALQSLQVVSRNLLIANAPALTAVSLPALTAVGHVLEVERTAATTIAAPALAVVGNDLLGTGRPASSPTGGRTAIASHAA